MEASLMELLTIGLPAHLACGMVVPLRLDVFSALNGFFARGACLSGLEGGRPEEHG